MAVDCLQDSWYKTTIILTKWRLEDNDKYQNLIVPEETPCCSECHSPLKIYDRRLRICKTAGGHATWLTISRMRCTNKDCSCNTIHNAIPDILSPYKHYDAGLIEDVIDDVVTEDDPETENYPCSDTMKDWKAWISKNKTNIDGMLRSFGKLLLDFSDEFLFECSSLFEQLKSRISPGWLKMLNWLLYNHNLRITPLRRLMNTTHLLFFDVTT